LPSDSTAVKSLKFLSERRPARRFPLLPLFYQTRRRKSTLALGFFPIRALFSQKATPLGKPGNPRRL
jgi:hypothetical protein